MLKIINFSKGNRTDILITTKEDLFANLPEDIKIEILGRLPITSIMRCKFVCKSWRHLIKGDEFAMLYTPKQGLTFVYRDIDMRYFVNDEAFKPLFRIGSPSHSGGHVIIASVNGLLSVWDSYAKILFIFNPMTREYVVLPPLSTPTNTRFFGFGVSRIRGQYKILLGDASSCHVYTLGRGTGSWRSIAPVAVPGVRRLSCDCAVFFNGNLHWLAFDSGGNFSVCCFDLETELFTSFSVPCDFIGKSYGINGLYILEGRLSLCNILNWRTVIIWKMDNYGDENSWIKEYSFYLREESSYLYVIEVLANGDLLFTDGNPCKFPTNDRLFIYSKSTRDIMTYGHSKQCYSSNIVVYTPSLISLTTMGFHNVQMLSS